MGTTSSMCSGKAAVSAADYPHRPPLRSRETGEQFARPSPPPPYFSEGNTNHSGPHAVHNDYGIHHGYADTTPNEPPPPYRRTPQHQPRLPAAQPTSNTAAHTGGRILDFAAVEARSAHPTVVDDPGDLWLSSELPPSSPVHNEEAYDNGDDVHDFDTPPDGHLVLGSLREYEAFHTDFTRSRSDGQLFEDPDFGAEGESVFCEEPSRGSNIKWLRPHELRTSPQLVIDGFSQRDVVQGELGDCWFLAPLSAVAKMPALIEKVVPTNQSFDVDQYTGMFRFRFWRFGRWVSVVVDDRLPTRGGRLIFARSSDPDEFWPSLLEKAYAKLHGSYSGLAGGMAADAFVDLAGGLAEVYDLTEHSTDDIYGILYRGTRSGAFVCCSRKGDWRANETNNLGIVTGHSYSIDKVQTGLLEGGKTVRLVHIRNPWANSTEWQGKWSDTSQMWHSLQNREEFEESEGRYAADGEFWMSYADFLKEFTKVVLSTAGPDFDGDGIPDIVNDTARGYHLVTRHGRWMKGVNAGGCQNYIREGFHSNPQIMITLLESDDWNADRGTSSESRGKCAIIITLLQEYRRLRHKRRTKKQQIGFVLYKVEDTERPLTRDDVMYMRPVGKSGVYINHREIVARFVLEPGHYCAIGSTFNPDISLRFMTRIFTEKPILCTALQTG